MLKGAVYRSLKEPHGSASSAARSAFRRRRQVARLLSGGLPPAKPPATLETRSWSATAEPPPAKSVCASNTASKRPRNAFLYSAAVLSCVSVWLAIARTTLSRLIILWRNAE